MNRPVKVSDTLEGLGEVSLQSTLYGEYVFSLMGKQFKVRQDVFTSRPLDFARQFLEKLGLEVGEDKIEQLAKTFLKLAWRVEKKPLREIFNFWTLYPVYANVRSVYEHASGEVHGVEVRWRLWAGVLERGQPPYLIYDTNGFVNEARRQLSLTAIKEPDEIDKILRELPGRVKYKLKDWAHGWGWRPQKQDSEPDAEVLAQLGFFTKPVPRLKTPEILESMDWKGFVEELVAYKTDQKDRRLRLAHKAHLLCGLDMRVNPHSLQVTNSGTGKSTFYQIMGRNFGKVTAKSFLGFAKSPEEIYPGVINYSEEPIGIDQIESQSASQVFRFMFNAMEAGEDRVSSGSTDFLVKTRSIFAILANPMKYASSPAKSFQAFIEHISENPAFGRRIGLIIYGNNFGRISHKPAEPELKEWKEKAGIFRAVEAYAWKELNHLINDPRIRQWLHQDLKGYVEAVEKAVENIQDDVITDFLIEHAHGAQVRIRGAALYVAMAEMLDKIALKKYTIQEVLELAEEYLPQFVELNLESISRINQAYAEEQTIFAKTVFESSPSYLKEIISAIELWRREKGEEEFLLSQIPYKPSDPTYKHFSKCINKLNNRKNIDSLLETFQRHYRFSLIQIDRREWRVRLLDKNPINYIEPIGRLYTVSPISPSHQPPRDTLSTLKDEKCKTRTKNERKKKEKNSLKKRLNGEPGEMVKNKSLTQCLLLNSTSSKKANSSPQCSRCGFEINERGYTYLEEKPLCLLCLKEVMET